MLKKYIILPALTILHQRNFIDLLVKYPSPHHVEVGGIESHPTPAQPPKLMLEIT